MVNDKKEWIESHSHMIKDHTNQKVYIYGKENEIIEKETIRVSVNRVGNALYVNKTKEIETRKILIEYLKSIGSAELKYLTHKYSKILNKEVNAIRLKDVKTRWGSCSSKGNINYSVWLLGAPKEVIEYVVIHEVCHLVHMNHSKEFWDLVESLCPKYEIHINWLKKNGFLISL